MLLEHLGLTGVSGPLVILEGVEGIGFDEIAVITVGEDDQRLGRVIQIDGSRAILQVFEGTVGIALDGTRTRFTGRPLELPLSPEMLGRIFDGAGRPIDGLGELYAMERRDINGSAINPVSRVYPRNCIYTGVSAIDAMCTLIRGQKLPIFSGSGMKHNEVAAQIVRQAKISAAVDAGGDAAGSTSSNAASNEDVKFAVVFAAMGIKNDTAEFFRRDFEKSGALQRVVMFMNLASDPIIERIFTPRCALTAAEYLAFEHGYHVLVIMTDMASYCEALREFSSSKGEIPSRKGYPSYLYSDLASLYERAGMIRGRSGSVTQMPILTMPNDDITHPIPDLTGFITEGQIVLDRNLEQMGLYPPIAVLPSLSRLMKDGIGKGYTREDHPQLSNQLFATYAMAQEARSLASVIGEDELSDTDKRYMQFARSFEDKFIRQGDNEDRSLDETMEIGWEAISVIPVEELDRIDAALLRRFYAKGAQKLPTDGA